GFCLAHAIHGGQIVRPAAESDAQLVGELPMGMAVMLDGMLDPHLVTRDLAQPRSLVPYHPPAPLHLRTVPRRSVATGVVMSRSRTVGGFTMTHRVDDAGCEGRNPSGRSSEPAGGSY